MPVYHGLTRHTAEPCHPVAMSAGYSRRNSTEVLPLPYHLDGPSGTYKLRVFIASGHYGSVYEAERDDGSTWAVKILPPGDPNGPKEVSVDCHPANIEPLRALRRLCAGGSEVD